MTIFLPAYHGFSGKSPGSPGTTGLEAWWELNEASGNRSDSHGSNTLTDNNTVGSTTGKQSNAADFVASNSEYLSIADNASLSTGDIDFTFAGWVYLDSKSSPKKIAQKRSSSTAREWQVFYSSSTDRFQMAAYDNSGSAIGVVSADTLGSPSTGAWYFIVAWHDSGLNTVNIEINNGGVDSTATTGVPSDTGGIFTIGVTVDSGPSYSNYFDGRIDEVGFWKRVLTSEERSWLYNSGNGRSYNEL